jgi:hypothetical protein
MTESICFCHVYIANICNLDNQIVKFSNVTTSNLLILQVEKYYVIELFDLDL